MTAALAAALSAAERIRSNDPTREERVQAAEDDAEAAAWCRRVACPGCSGPAVVVDGRVFVRHALLCGRRRAERWRS